MKKDKEPADVVAGDGEKKTKGVFERVADISYSFSVCAAFVCASVLCAVVHVQDREIKRAHGEIDKGNVIIKEQGAEIGRAYREIEEWGAAKQKWAAAADKKDKTIKSLRDNLSGFESKEDLLENAFRIIGEQLVLDDKLSSEGGAVSIKTTFGNGDPSLITSYLVDIAEMPDGEKQYLVTILKPDNKAVASENNPPKQQDEDIIAEVPPTPQSISKSMWFGVPSLEKLSK